MRCVAKVVREYVHILVGNNWARGVMLQCTVGETTFRFKDPFYGFDLGDSVFRMVFDEVFWSVTGRMVMTDLDPWSL